MASPVDDLLCGLGQRIDTPACSDLASKVGMLNQRVDGLARDNNVILGEEIASLKYGESAADKARRKRSKAEHLSLTMLGDDASVHIASFLDAKGIARLGRTCRHFGVGFVGSGGQMTSLAEELAGQVVHYSATNYEKSVLVGGRNVWRLHELELMRKPLSFEQLVGSGSAIRHPHPEYKSMISMSDEGQDEVTAISNHVMRKGRHYVTFHISGTGGGDIGWHFLDFGVLRPINNLDKKSLKFFEPIFYYDNFNKEYPEYRKQLLAEKTDEWGDILHCCCFDSTHGGKCYYANWNSEDKSERRGGGGGDEWGGMGGIGPLADIDTCTVGLLLDLHIGTLSVFKDGRKLGVMKEGLRGAYCWFVSSSEIKCTVKIERGMPPAM